MGKRYFITGATGCIGGWVVKNLIESGREVYALVRLSLIHILAEL